MKPTTRSRNALKTIGGALLACLVALLAAGQASATPVVWSGNGHSYDVRSVPGGIGWAAAYDSSLAMGGYLATLTTAEEHAFVYSLVSGRPELWYIDGAGNGSGPWLGGYQPPGSSEPGGNWRWVSGEAWAYAAWSPGEPNNWGGNESRVQFFKLGSLIGDRWNDAPESSPVLGYVVEVPTPARACTTWAVTGHSYQVVHTPTRLSWTAASAAAVAHGGHLATITSAEENDFIASLTIGNTSLWYLDTAGNGQGPWIGGLQGSGSPEPSGGWGWVTGEPFTFTAWASGEPNNLNGNEHYLQLFGKGQLTGKEWNDMALSTAYGGLGYVIEYESGGGCVTLGVEDISVSGLTMLPARPNPTSGRTQVELELPRAARVTADVFDIAGRRVRRLLVNERLEAGHHALGWDGSGERGARLASGIYSIRVDADGIRLVRRVVLAH